MAELQYQKRFKLALNRLAREFGNLLTEQAAIAAYQEAQPPRNYFLATAFIGMLGDRLVRLIRIFENSKRTASFWYLHRCAPQRISNLDIGRLEIFSEKLKTVRDRTFVHLDKKGIFDALVIWQKAGITEDDIAHAIETGWGVVNDLWSEEFGKPPISIADSEDPRSYNPDLDGFKRLMKKSFADLSGTVPPYMDPARLQEHLLLF